MAVQRRNTRQRRLVLDAVRALHNGHPTADDVFVEVRRHDGRISRGTVYRNLSLLSDEGMIQQLKTPGGSRFDDLDLPYDAGADTGCARSTGYADVSHYTFFEGLCPACQTREA